jgi:hypothetical protein
MPKTARLTLAAAGALSLALAGAPAFAAPPSSGTATPSITAGPAAGSFVAATSATFRFSDKTAKATFSCSLDGATAAACTSPKTYSGLAQGKHTFTVTATAGTSTSSAATRTWTVDTVAPKPAIAAPTTLTGPVVVAFGEPVRAAKSAVLATLTVTGGNAVASTTSCWRGTTSVACASALFDTARVKPTSRLTPGQHYTVSVAAAVVNDRAGNANTAVSKAFRGERSLQETAPGIAASWQKVASSSAAGGSFVREHLAGAAAAWTFTGTAITWWTVTGPAYGKADVYIDGTRNRTVNLYAASRHFNASRTIGGLANKSHRLRIVVLGTKGNKAGTGTFVAVDAFTVGGTKTTSPVLATSWRPIANSHLSAGHAVVTDLANAAIQFTFRGTGVSWFTVKGPNQGKAAVYVDGVRKATYDNYAATTSFGVKRALSGLTDGVHTFKIVVLGKHRSGAKGSLVTVDRLLVA